MPVRLPRPRSSSTILGLPLPLLVVAAMVARALRGRFSMGVFDVEWRAQSKRITARLNRILARAPNFREGCRSVCAFCEG
jgi:hypothetical protein